MKEELQMLAEKIWAGHKGMCLGGLGGVLLATCILLFGFWNMLFVCLLGGIGLFIGVNRCGAVRQQRHTGMLMLRVCLAVGAGGGFQCGGV
ncbi:MAG: DUF2273 domain-containing protein, partial [Selenomonadaceae bacterium]|nr:DUF2273 domain-containing protein [Selenomonadaceae bacterium]